VRLPSDLAVLRLRNFRLVFGASAVSLVGDGVVPVALTFAVLDLTGSATDLGIVLAARTIALVASLLVGGVVADRIGRRTVMVSADLVRLVTQAAVAVLLVSGHATVPEIAISQVLLGAASGFFNPASSGLIPAVAGEWLQQANALRGMALAVGNIAGPAIARPAGRRGEPGVGPAGRCGQPSAGDHSRCGHTYGRDHWQASRSPPVRSPPRPLQPDDGRCCARDCGLRNCGRRDAVTAAT
jgi:hypothetical protein